MVVEVPAKVAVAREDDVGLEIGRQPVGRVPEQKHRMTRRDRFGFHLAEKQRRFAGCRAHNDAGVIEIQAAREHARQVHPVLAGPAVHQRRQVAHHLYVSSRSGRQRHAALDDEPEHRHAPNRSERAPRPSKDLFTIIGGRARTPSAARCGIVIFVISIGLLTFMSPSSDDFHPSCGANPPFLVC